MKKKLIITAALTAALMAAGVVGGTIAYFTSEAKTEISMTAGTVKVQSEVELVKATSLGEPVSGGLFENGGTYSLTNNVLTLSKVTPGDAVILKVTASNASDVNIKWRIKKNVSGALASGLDFKVYTDAELQTEAAGMGVWSDVTTASDLGTYYVKVELPVEAGNEYQGTEAEIALIVEAVQGNMVTPTEIDAPATTTTEEINAFTNEIVNTQEEHLQINLVADTTIYITGNSIKFGDETLTKDITIVGNGHTLTWEERNTDYSAIHLSNPEAVLTIKDCNMTSTHPNKPSLNTGGTWNAHDILFDCNTVLENVNSDTALAFGGKYGQHVSLTNVVINESRATSGIYGLWITTGATVDINGLTVKCTSSGASDFRGIKVADEYNTDALDKQVTTINISNAVLQTASKGGVYVSSLAETHLNASNVDISGVAKDQVNLACADKKSPWNGNADKIICTGCTAIAEA